MSDGRRSLDASDIQAEYDRLGYDLGWTFMMTPAARLHDAKVCLVGLNPGGGDPGDHLWSVEEGNAYFRQRWGKDKSSYSSLQLQIHELARLCGVGEDEMLAAQFIPFRSRSLRSLAQQQSAFEFGRKLWAWVMASTPATVFLCLGNDAAAHLRQVAEAKPCADASSLPTGWGRTTIDSWKTAGSGLERRVIVRLPHLSSYRIFGRPKGKSDLAVSSLLKALS